MQELRQRSRLALRLGGWRRRWHTRLAVYALALLGAATALGLRYRSYARWEAAGPPPPNAAVGRLWFRPAGELLTPVVGDPRAGDLDIACGWVHSVRSTRPQRMETIQLAIRVTSVRDFAGQDLEPFDVPLVLARSLWTVKDLTPELIRRPSDPGAVVLRYRNPATFRVNAAAHVAEFAPFLGAAWLALVGVGEGLALLGRRLLPPGHCTRCGYPLADIPGGVCPECGRAG